MDFSKKKLNGKRGDINLSFGMIFSIILIAVFIFAAIYAINFFLNYGKTVQVGNFYEDLQREINDAFMSQSTENRRFSVNLPGDINKICFANASETQRGSFLEEYGEIEYFYMEDYNLFLFPPENSRDIPFKKIDKINLTKIIENENPYCIENGKDLLLTKRIYDRGVLITRD